MTMFDFSDTEQNNNMNVILEVIENPNAPISTLKAILEKTTSQNIAEHIKSKIMHAVDVAIQKRNSVEIIAFDFGDGKGAVPAHRHINPDSSLGGWVADTASVDSSVYVGENVVVYGLARVFEESKLSDNVRVFGKAQIFGSSCISDNASVGDNAKIYGETHVGGNACIQGYLELCKNSKSAYFQNYQSVDSTAEKTTPKADAQKLISKEKNKDENIKKTTISFDFANDKEKMLKAAKNPKTSPDILDSLVKNSSIVIRTAAINNPNIRPSTLEDIATKTQGDSIIFAIATNTKASTESLAILLRREISRNTLARNPNTPIQLLIALAESDCSSVFYNPNLPFETLEFLAQKDNHYAMSALAWHPNTTFETLNVLAEKGNNVAMSALARHPNTPFETLKILAEKGEQYAISTLTRNSHTPLNLLESLIQRYNNNCLASFLAKNSQISIDTLMCLAARYTTHHEVRISIANNKNATSEILDLLIYNPNGEKYKTGKLCLSIAKHPNTSAELLGFLSQSKDAEVVKAVVNNPTNKSTTGFKIPPPPEPLQFNTERISEIKTESKKLSAMLNTIYEQDNLPPEAPKINNSSVLNLDDTHLDIVKILATRPEWERDELQTMM
ncbi:MAG: hypothetical protein WCL34_12400, partial [Methylococcaceae bacterium]